MMMRKKIVIINDIHANYLLLNKILDYAKKEKVTDYIIGGDAITDGIWVNEVLDKLRELKPIMINGNREESIINYDGYSWENNPRFALMLYTYKHISPTNWEFIKNNPTSKIVNVAVIKICVSHGSPYKVRELVYADDYELFDKLIKDFGCDVYLFAHTHIPFATKYKNRYFINAGALFPCYNKGVVTFGILDIDNDIVNYTPVELQYDFKEVKKFYSNSLTYQVSPEWSNIIINEFNKYKDYYNAYAEYLNKYYKNCDNSNWKEAFNKFIEENNLDIY